MIRKILVAGGIMALAVFMIGSASAFAFGPRGDSEGQEGRGFHRGHRVLTVVAEQLGLTRDELKAELVAGKTISEVAVEQGVATDAVVDAVVAIRAEKLYQAVEDGRITQEQADEHLARIESKITERLDQTWPFGEGRHKGMRGSGHDGGRHHGRPVGPMGGTTSL